MKALKAAHLMSVAVTSTLAASAFAQQAHKDIVEAPIDLVGPGTVSVVVKGDTMLKFGGLVRLIPTAENNWDFGASKYARDAGGTALLRQHVNEAGWVSKSYTRSEARTYFSAMAPDQSWSFYTALEFDRPLETATVDERGGKLDTSSDFGMERLVGTVKLPGTNMRLYAGWDIWGVDIPSNGLIYGDDNPGIWIKGEQGTLSYSVAWMKLKENSFQNQPTFNLSGNLDRDLYGGYVDFVPPAAGRKLRAIYLLDKSKGIPLTTTARRFSQPAPLPALGTADSVTASHVGGFWEGRLADFTLAAFGVYQFGSANVTSSTFGGDYDIRAFAVAGDLSFDIKSLAGGAITPIIGFSYSSGDKSPSDRKLGGYSSVTDLSRFGKWGGEELISADTNFVLGTPLYGLLPTGLGNGTPVVTGGVQNLQGAGFGRGDNPGLGMLAAGVRFNPWHGTTHKTVVRGYWWNEDQVVTSWVDGTTINPVKSGYVGIEWSNDLAWRLNKVVTFKAQATFLFPGKALKQANAALTATAGGLGRQDAKVATRIGAELVWAF